MFKVFSYWKEICNLTIDFHFISELVFLYTAVQQSNHWGLVFPNSWKLRLFCGTPELRIVSSCPVVVGVVVVVKGVVVVVVVVGGGSLIYRMAVNKKSATWYDILISISIANLL